MPLSRRRFFQATLATALAPTLARRATSAAKDFFEPSWESLVAQYRAPEWFRDAKFGIWAHWSAQCVPEQGDWYGRLMYLQGTPFYDYHVKTYGHPSKFGLMEIENLWKAEHWDPQALMGLYKAAGAKYFVSLANHHDNLDNYPSRHHAWNSMRVGPKKNIVGTWEKIARAHGLRFGVSNHSAHAWHWYQPAYGYDGEGPLAGVRYDADRLKKADGKGKWWEGLDPQELYTGPNIRMPDGIRGAAAVNEWQDKNSGQWVETPPPTNPEFVRKWSLRCRDLIDQVHPDLIYFDNYSLPFGQVGLDMAAHYYNTSRRWHDGRLEVVANAKMLPPEHRAALVDDVERGASDELRPLPWQTCTCIGNWHYDRTLFERHEYKSARLVAQTLTDIVSKNGNLLLSVPLRGDGTIDADEHRILEDLAVWMKIHGEAIYGTRPWKVFGEGPSRPAAGMNSEGKRQPFTAEDIRFTTRGETLYALALDASQATTLTIKSLPSNAMAGKVERVEQLGLAQPLRFEHTPQGLTITLPAQNQPQGVWAVRINGRGVVAG